MPTKFYKCYLSNTKIKVDIFLIKEIIRPRMQQG